MGRECNPVGWFEIPVEDMERACSFYRRVFSFSMEIQEQAGVQMAWFPMLGDETGAAGSLVKATDYVPSLQGVLVYFTAPDMEKILGMIEGAGGKVLQGRTGIGRHGYVAFVSDTEGNRIGLHSRA
ncbi:MAG: VOC family protein [Candidatus Fermentibacteraceae bacterium]|nr:VOC family protein [Candidatus Fermentibacteraceae bacterium]MBN2607495.1 VOC family protein [Candidatus Fermentibacteraceae bacterium]